MSVSLVYNLFFSSNQNIVFLKKNEFLFHEELKTASFEILIIKIPDRMLYVQ